MPSRPSLAYAAVAVTILSWASAFPAIRAESMPSTSTSRRPAL